MGVHRKLSHGTQWLKKTENRVFNPLFAVTHLKMPVVWGLTSLWSFCRDQSCGTLFCSGGWEFPVTSKKSFYTVRNGIICNEAAMNPEDNYPSDLGMVPTGTKCGTNMVKRCCLPARSTKS